MLSIWENLLGAFREFNRRVAIHFGGAESVLSVYVNGRFVGCGKDSRLPAEFDLTKYVSFGRKNTVAAVVIKWIRRKPRCDGGLDPNRPLHYEAALWNTPEGSILKPEHDFAIGDHATDAVCPMYVTLDRIKEWALSEEHPNRRRPLILCEFSHAMGNSHGSLDDYFDLFETLPGIQGLPSGLS